MKTVTGPNRIFDNTWLGFENDPVSDGLEQNPALAARQNNKFHTLLEPVVYKGVYRDARIEIDQIFVGELQYVGLVNKPKDPFAIG